MRRAVVHITETGIQLGYLLLQAGSQHVSHKRIHQVEHVLTGRVRERHSLLRRSLGDFRVGNSKSTQKIGMELLRYFRICAFLHYSVKILEVLLAAELRLRFGGWFLDLLLRLFRLLLLQLLQVDIGIDLIDDELLKLWVSLPGFVKAVPRGIALQDLIGKHLVLLRREPILGCFLDLFLLLLLLRLLLDFRINLLLGFGSLGRLLRRSEEHTSELQSRLHLVCRLLLEKKKHI